MKKNIKINIDTNSPIPLYYQLFEHLREQIMANLFKPGDSIPSESELIRDSGLSRGTVRQALQILTQEGLVERHPGRGTFVSYPKIEQNANRVMGFYSNTIIESGKIPSAKIIEIKEFSAPELIRSKLQIGNDESIVFIKRLRKADDILLAIESSYFIYDVGQKLLKEDLLGSIYEILQKKYDYVIHRSENTIDASIADSETGGILGIETNNLIFVIRRLVFLNNGKPFEYSEDIIRADRIRFSIEDNYQDDKIKFTFKPTQLP